VLAAAIGFGAAAGVSAHRLDEYLQAARIAIDPGGVKIEMSLTPGVAVADAIIAEIDRDRDGTLSRDEQRAYASTVVNGTMVEVDGMAVRTQLGAYDFPDLGSMKRGEAAIAIQWTVMFPRPPAGAHRLTFRNHHHPDASVYLANALVPESDDVAVTAQQRDRTQSELTIEYVLRARPSGSAAWLVGIGAAALLVSAALLTRSAIRLRWRTTL